MNKLSKILALLAVFVFSGFIASAQKFAFVDTEYILSNLPDYTSKQKQLDEMSVQWQAEIETMYKDIDKMYSDYQAEEILLNTFARSSPKKTRSRDNRKRKKSQRSSKTAFWL
jgi:outer membrane protein